MRIGWGDDNGKFNDRLTLPRTKAPAGAVQADFHYDGGKLFSADGKTLC